MNAVFNVFLILKHGGLGAGIATVIAESSVTFASFVLVKKSEVSVRKLFRYFLAVPDCKYDDGCSCFPARKSHAVKYSIHFSAYPLRVCNILFHPADFKIPVCERSFFDNYNQTASRQ